MEQLLTVPSVSDESPATPLPVADQPTARQSSSNALSRFRQLPTFRALHYGDYRLLLLGQTCGSMSMWMDQVARGWLLYELTDSPLQLGLLRGIQAIPLLVLSPIAGSAADRYDRKRQIMVSQVVDAVLFAVVAILILSRQIQPWHIYVTAFLDGAVSTFQQPARLAMMAESVPKHHLTNAIGLGSVLFNVTRSTGPALAGVLIAVVGTYGSYLAQSLFQIAGLACALPLPDSLRRPLASGERRSAQSFVQSMRAGFTYGWANQPVRAALLITASASLFIIPFTTLLPVIARDVLGVGAQGQGFLLTGMGIGAFCSAVMIASLGDRLPRGILMLVGVTLYGLAVIAFSASPWFPLAVGLMVIVGLFHVSSHALVHTVIQTYTDAEFRGRINALFQLSQVVNTVGATIIGGVATALGAPTAIAGMAALGAMASATIAVAVPVARRIR